MFVSYLVNPLLVRRYPVMSVSSGLSSEHVQNFPPDKTDKDASLMYGHYVAFTLHKSISRVSSIRGDEFCHRITKFCMFCPFSLRNKSICWSDQALRVIQIERIIYANSKLNVAQFSLNIYFTSTEKQVLTTRTNLS